MLYHWYQVCKWCAVKTPLHSRTLESFMWNGLRVKFPNRNEMERVESLLVTWCDHIQRSTSIWIGNFHFQMLKVVQICKSRENVKSTVVDEWMNFSLPYYAYTKLQLDAVHLHIKLDLCLWFTTIHHKKSYFSIANRLFFLRSWVEVEETNIHRCIMRKKKTMNKRYRKQSICRYFRLNSF